MKNTNRRKLLQATMSLAVSLILSVTVFSICSFATVSYNGRGTKNDPYIITTPAQLDGMRNNLNATYKLGANIDMSKFGNFVSIGTSAKPFKGSLLCDADSSGKPLYAISNLKINLKAKGCTRKEKFSGFKKDGSAGWEVGLIGRADGSTLENIILLNVNVKSNVEGLYKMNSDYSLNPVDYQSTGALVGTITNGNVIGCGVTGKVVTYSNYAGGLIGSVENSGIKRCYSMVDFTSKGTWGSGGIAGAGVNVSVSECFYDGNMKGSVTHGGALVGSFYAKTGITVKDCWAGGTVDSDKTGTFYGVKNHSDEVDKESIEFCSNVYTISRIKNSKAVQSNGAPISKTNKIFVSKQVKGCLQKYFYPATKAEINKAFKGLANWTVGSGYPQLKNVKVIKSLKDLGKVSANQSASGGKNSGTADNQNSNNNQNSANDNNNNIQSNSQIVPSNTYKIQPVQQQYVLSMNTADKVIAIVALVLVAISIVGGVITIVFAMKFKKSTIVDSLTADYEEDENDIEE